MRKKKMTPIKYAKESKIYTVRSIVSNYSL